MNRSGSRGGWIEPALALAILAGLVWCGWHLAQNGYLPAPFFYEPDDTYADWFHPAFWSRDPGTYDSWKSIYPPLSFVVLNFVGLDSCYDAAAGNGVPGRGCDWVGTLAIFVIFAVNLALTWIALARRDRRTAAARTICVALGFPMVYALERGNLVMLSYTCLLLAYGPVLKSARLRWLAAGLAVNFKIYLVAGIVPLLLKRRWYSVESALLAAIIVYLFSYALLGRGTPAEIYGNIRDFAQQPLANPLDFWFATTYLPLVSLLKGEAIPVVIMLGSHGVELAETLLPLLQRVTQGLIILAALACWLRPEPVPFYRVINLGLLMALITAEAGGYTCVYFMLFVMFEPWRGFGRCWAIVACYLLAMPLDYTIDTLPPLVRESYFNDVRTLVSFHISIGPFLRPLLIMSIGWALSLVTIRDVWADVREQGWAGRWRFRRDAALLPGTARPLPPRQS